MKLSSPSRVLISGGREIGGLSSFAQSLRDGFVQQGIEAEIVSPANIFRRWSDLRDPSVLKILSTTAVFAAPFARRAICVAHGFPRSDYQGLLKFLAILTSFKLVNRSSGCQLIAVSHYVALHLSSIFNLRIDAVVHNPLNSVFLEPGHITGSGNREYITYVGRLISVKNLHRLLPILRDLLDEAPGLRVCIIGAGDLQPMLESLVRGDSRFEFCGPRDPVFIRDQLRRTTLFVSGCETEALGIAYVEALTQGCVVAMPASGGGIEICPEEIGRTIHLLPLSWDRDEALAVLRRTLNAKWHPISTQGVRSETVASLYLKADASFSARGRLEVATRGRVDEGIR